MKGAFTKSGNFWVPSRQIMALVLPNADWFHFFFKYQRGQWYKKTACWTNIDPGSNIKYSWFSEGLILSNEIMLTSPHMGLIF